MERSPDITSPMAEALAGCLFVKYLLRQVVDDPVAFGYSLKRTLLAVIDTGTARRAL